MPEQFCRWELDEHSPSLIHDDKWNSACGEYYTFPSGVGPSGDGWNYCPYCAKPIQQEDGADE